MGTAGELSAQQPGTADQQVAPLSYSSQLQPVPKAGFQTPARAAEKSQHQSRDLSWRKSTATHPVPTTTSLQLRRTVPMTQNQSVIRQTSGESVIVPAHSTAAHSTAAHSTAAQAFSSRRGYTNSGLQLANTAPTLHPINQDSSKRASDQTTSHTRRPNTMVANTGVSRAAWNEHPVENANSVPDYFTDPFNDSPPTASLSLPHTKSPAVVRQNLPATPRSRNAESMPLELRPANGLRTNIAQLELPTAEPPVPTTPAPTPAPPIAAAQGGPGLSPPGNAVPSQPLQLAPREPRPTPEQPQQAVPEATPTLPLSTQSVTPAPVEPPAAKPPQANSERSLGEILQQRTPSNQGSKNNTPAAETTPSLRGDTAPPSRPFSDQLRNADQIDKERLNNGKTLKRGFGVGGDVLEDLPFSCEDFRKRIASQTIDQVSLDISPPYRPDEMDEKRYQGLKEEFDEKQSIRTWHDRNGNPLVTGRLNDLAYEKAVIETNEGSKDALPINQLSEGDIAYIAENWGLPKECLIEQVAYTPRQWTPSTMTWKASNLCHHPLYFEDVNLERYGHTRGPIIEPVVQSAHFFANIAVLPYKMGVHCPSECQYALGYYRPGNCSPWIKPPVPISARGAIAQAATMTGMFWLIP